MTSIPSGTLRLIQSQPNPQGAKDSQLFLFAGDPGPAPIHKIVLDDDVVLPSSPPENLSRSRYVKILHINDLHGHFLRWTSEGSEPVFSRIAGKVQEIRAVYQDDPDTVVLFLTAGDDIVGSLFDELLEENDAFSMHAAYQLYSAAGIDSSVLGNHDLDFGPGILAKGIQQNARFPILSANLQDCHPIEELYYPAALFITKGIRIGIIGLTTSAQMRQPLNSKLKIFDPIIVTNNLLPAIRPLCDVLIVLSHLGLSQKASLVSTALVDVGDVELARGLPSGKVDLIVGGHTHDALNRDGLQTENIINGIPVVQGGAFGEFLGEVEVKLQNGNASVTSASLMVTEALPACEAFEAKEIQPLFSRVQKIGTRILGKVENDPQLGTQVVCKDFAAGELALANFITDGIVTSLNQDGYDVDIAMIDASSIVCGVPFGGELSYKDCFRKMPYADTIRFYQMTGAELYDLLQDNILRLDRSEEDHVERGFLQFSEQVRYCIDLEASRVKEILINNIPLMDQMDKVFTIATSVFTRELAKKWEANIEKESNTLMLKLENLPFVNSDIFLRKLFVAYIQEHGGITHAGGAQLDGRLHIVPDTRNTKTPKIQNHNHESRRL